MSLSEKTAYLRGLYEGMELNTSDSKEAKILGAMLDVLQELAAHVTENEDSIAAVADQMDDVAEALDELNEILCEENDELLQDGDMDDESNYEDCDEDDGEDDFVLNKDMLFTSLEVECPNCQTMLTVGEEELSEGIIKCNTCGESFQINFEFEEDEDEES